MSRYDEYVSKVEKVKAVKNQVYRFRAPIIIVGAALSMSLVAFLSTKGMILSDLTVSDDTITYGDTYQIQLGKSLFGSTSCEFKLDGTSNWSSKYPSTPGTYSIREVSRRSFGAKSYGKEHKITILPRDVELKITSSSIEYGSSPRYSINLVNNDKIDNIEFIYDDISLESTQVQANDTTLKITSKEGENVTSCYNVTFVKSDIDLTQVNLSLSMGILSKDYDATSEILFKNDTKIEGATLKYSDELTYSFTIKNSSSEIVENPIDADDYSCVVDSSSIKIMNGEYDVTSHYLISTPETSFKINKKKLTIKTDDFSKDYDGTSLSTNFENSFEIISGSTCNGQTAVIDEMGNEAFFTLIDAFEQANDFKVKIEDKDHNDYSNNYEISYQKGTLSIKRLTVKIAPQISIEEYKYDGNTISYSLSGLGNYEYIGSNRFVGDDNVQINVMYRGTINASNIEMYSNNISFNSESILNVGTYEAYISSIEYSTSINKNNYNIVYDVKSVKITPRMVTLDLFDDNLTYNGTFYSYALGYSLSSSSKDTIVTGDSFNFDYQYLDSKNNNVTPIDAGTYEICYKTNSLSCNTYISNYIVNYNSSTLVINPRDIYVKPVEHSKEYDGKVFVYDSTQFEYYGVSLTNDENRFINNEENSSYGDLLITVTEKNEKEMKNAGSYTLTISSFTKSNNYKYNKDNYILHTEDTTLVIDRRQVVIKPTDYDEFIYDGTLKSYPYDSNFNFDVVSSSIIDGDTFKITVSIDRECKNAGEYITSIVSITENDNYIFSKLTGKLTINQRSIYITPNEAEHEYDGEYFVYEENINNFSYWGESSTNNLNQLVTGESLIITCKYYDNYLLTNPKDVLPNNRKYVIDFDSIVAGENTIKENYDIQTRTSTLNITPRSIHIAPKTYEGKIYDGEVYVYEYYFGDVYGNFDYVEGSKHLVDGEDIKIIAEYYSKGQSAIPFNVGKYEIAVEDIIPSSSTSLLNYNITKDKSSFDITVRNVSITLHQFDDYTYNGEYLSYNIESFDYSVTSELGIVSGDTLYGICLFENSGTSYNKVKDASSTSYFTFVKEYSIENNTFGDVKSNYKISFTNTSFNILRREVFVKPVDEESVFNGEFYHHSNNIEYYGESLSNLDNAIVSGEAFALSINSYYFVDDDINVQYPFDAGTYYIIDCKVVSSNSISDVNNYVFTLEKGTISISPRTIYIAPKDCSSIYNGNGYVYSSEPNNFVYTNSNSLYKLCNDDQLIISVIYDGDSSIIPVNVKEEGFYSISISSVEFVNGARAANYDPKYGEGRLTITPRSIYITPFAIEKVYDGISLEYKYEKNNFGYYGLSIDNENNKLVDGQSLRVTVSYDGQSSAPKNVKGSEGVYIIDIDTSMIEYLDGALARNYSINTKTSTYKINRRTLYISLIAFENKVFDDVFYRYSEEYGNFEYTSKSISSAEYRLVDGEEMRIHGVFDSNKMGSIKDAGNHYLYYSSFDVKGNDSSSNNYNIECEKQYFEITPLEIHILPLEIGEIIYSEQAYVYPLVGVDSDSNCVFTLNKVLGDDILTISVKYKDNEGKFVDECIEPGTYYVVVDEDNYLLTNGALSNYTIVVDGEREFSIVKREITIAPSSTLIAELNAVYENSPTKYPNTIYNYDAIVMEGIATPPSIIIEVEFVLMNGDVETDKVFANNSTLNAGTYKVRIKSHSYDDSTQSGRFIVHYQEGDTFVITQRHIKVASSNIEVFFSINGYTNTTSKDYKLIEGTLAIGDRLTLELFYTKQNAETFEDTMEVEPTPTNVGVYFIHISNAQLVAGDIDDNYIVEYDTSVLVINPRTIYIKPIAIDNKTYDGKSLEYSNSTSLNYLYYDKSNFLSAAQLEEGQEITIIVDYIKDGGAAQDEAINAGKYSVHIKKILPMNDDTVISNYNFITENSEVEISKRSLIVSPSITYIEGGTLYQGRTDVYDGNNRTYNITQDINYVLDLDNGNSLVSGDSIHISSVNIYKIQGEQKSISICKDAGKYVFEIGEIEVSSGVNDNYDITKNTIEYTIIPRGIVLDTSSLNLDKVYDGQYIYSKDIKNEIPTDLFAPGDVVEYDLLIVSDEGETYSCKDVNTYSLLIKGFSVNGEVVSNYQLDITYEFEISKANLVIELKDISDVTYTAEEFDLYSSNEVQSISGAYETIDNLSIKYYYNGVETICKDSQTYTYGIDLLNSTFTDGNTLSRNYNVSYGEKSFTVNPYELNIKLINDSVEYFGDIYNYSLGFEDNDKILQKNMLLGEDTLSPVVSYLGSLSNTPKNVDTYTIVFEDVVFGDNTKSTNYVINSKTNATLYITPVQVKIVLTGDEVTYSGKTYTHDLSIEFVEGQLIGDDSIVVTNIECYDEEDSEVSPLNAGSYKLYITSYYFATGDSLNYSVDSSDYGKLVILRREINITPYSFEDKVYDDEFYSYPTYDENYSSYDTNSGPLGLSFKISIQFVNVDDTTKALDEVRYVGTYYLQVNDIISLNDISSNYEPIVDTSQQFTISPRTITVITGATVDSIEYDGNEYTFVRSEQIPYYDHPILANFAVDTSSENSLLEGHYAEMSKSSKAFSVTDANIYTVDISADVRREGTNEDLTANYDIIYIKGSFEVTRRELSVNTASHLNLIYNSSNQASDYNKFDQEIEIVSGTLTSNVASKIVNVNYVATNVGEYKNILSIDLKDKEGQSLNSNYHISYNYGDVSIIPRVLNLQLENTSEDYNANNHTLGYKNIVQNGEKVDFGKDNISITYDIYVEETMIKVTSMEESGNYIIILKDITINNTSYLENSNYQITIDSYESTFTINKLFMDVYSGSQTFAYVPFTTYSYPNVYGIAQGESGIIDEFTATYKDGGAYTVISTPGIYVDNIVEYEIIYNGKNISNNFYIKEYWGTLYICNTIEFSDFKYSEYNAKSVSNEKITFSAVAVDDKGNREAIDGLTIVLTDFFFTQNKKTNVVDAKDAGAYSIYVSKDNVKINYYYKGQTIELTDNLVFNEEEDEYGYYYFENVYFINKAKIYVKPIDKTKYYDGTPLTYGEDDYELFNSFSYSTKVDGNKFEGTISDGTYIYDGVLKVEYNYSTKNAIDYDLSIYKYYIYTDETCESELEYSSSYILLTDKEKQRYTKSEKYKNYSVFTSISSAFNASNNANLTDNDFRYKDMKQFVGNYSIVARTIYVKTYGAEKVYDGTPISNSENWEYRPVNEETNIQSGYDLLEGHEIKLSSGDPLSQTNPGKKLNKVYLDIYDKDGYRVTNNYKIKYIDEPDSYLVVNKRVLHLKTGSATMEYDGSTLVCYQIDAGPNELLENHYIEATFTGSISYVGTTQNTVKLSSIKVYVDKLRSDGVTISKVDVTNYYYIGIENISYGTLEITYA